MKRYLLALGIIICGFVSADAASLFGKVIDVNSGDSITIYNLNRPVRVRLMGVDAPEMDQAFGDVARKHLTDLVFEKSVLIEYAGIAADSSLTGRVLLNDADIGAQMIRDGAAWFDPNNSNRLSASDREVYQESEQAARNEKRGLWQQGNAVAPWEFVKAERMRRNQPVRSEERVVDAKPRSSGPAPELNNLTLMAKGANSAPAGSDTYSAWARSPARKNWSRFQLEGEDFSVDVPEGGERQTSPFPVGEQTVNLKSYTIRDGWAIYSVVWFKAPTAGEGDNAAFDELAKELVAGVTEVNKIDNRRSDFKCQSPTKKNIVQNGYQGVEIGEASCGIPWRARMFTKVVNNERVLYLAIAAYAEEDVANVTRFMKSFTVGTPKTRAH
jgi:endonuclease YncB( thermonuclease family)